MDHALTTTGGPLGHGHPWPSPSMATLGNRWRPKRGCSAAVSSRPGTLRTSSIPSGSRNHKRNGTNSSPKPTKMGQALPTNGPNRRYPDPSKRPKLIGDMGAPPSPLPSRLTRRTSGAGYGRKNPVWTPIFNGPKKNCCPNSPRPRSGGQPPASGQGRLLSKASHLGKSRFLVTSPSKLWLASTTCGSRQGIFPLPSGI